MGRYIRRMFIMSRACPETPYSTNTAIFSAANRFSLRGIAQAIPCREKTAFARKSRYVVTKEGFWTGSSADKRGGFTLIEILMYLGIFLFVIGGLLLTIYTVIGGSGRLQSRVFVSEEAVFILRKFDWALTGASAISVPSSDKLIITRPDFPPEENPLTFSWNAGSLTLARGTGSSVRLNSASVDVISLVFTEKSSTLESQFMLANLSQNQTFKFSKYLRKQ